MISILLATYNGERYITKSIESILNQTFQEFELLIGFNGTTDNSKNIVSEFNDPRIRVFDYGSDKGKAKTLNKLLKEVRYDWVAIQDDDDIWIQNKLLKQSELIDKDYDVIGTQIQYIDKNEYFLQNTPKLATKHELIKENCLLGINQIANSSSIIRKKSLEECKGWKDELEALEDFDLWLRMLKSNKLFINLNEVLVLHRLHEHSNFNTKSWDNLKIENIKK